MADGAADARVSQRVPSDMNAPRADEGGHEMQQSSSQLPPGTAQTSSVEVGTSTATATGQTGSPREHGTAAAEAHTTATGDVVSFKVTAPAPNSAGSGTPDDDIDEILTKESIEKFLGPDAKRILEEFGADDRAAKTARTDEPAISEHARRQRDAYGLASEREENTSFEHVRQKRGVSFIEELIPMMYGFGDVALPRPDTLEAMDDIVYDYVTAMLMEAKEVAATRGKAKTEDLVFLLRRDPSKYARVRELLTLNEQINRTRKAFDERDRS